ncbi:hydrogenase maturation nickel metallochaperone HypA [Bacillus carboniphilus]|uniref:Hydrogenase maturation factor HypA n=1 Tax=Bacillus carboniphilus TaxID=86663 RepID=A0ABY9JW21_9BACI|nr:hydrogenase maturation nickel metallochaperone HypA [Bacillus carboniphilus]WLR42703.1 hydrogenase maturation nickel metallochaperone HypA [Bacillus carboniphilus]
MHELTVIIQVVKSVEAFAKEEAITNIDTLVLQVGELSTLIPRYIEACYPAAVDGTMLKDTKLEIEILPGNALCKTCNSVYNLIKEDKICPKCKGLYFEILSGKEFMIKEIVAC